MPEPEPMDAQQFARDPWAAVDQGYDWLTAPQEWIALAWKTNPDFRAECLDALVRSLDKRGSFASATDFAELLAPALDPDQAVDLYREIAAQTGRNPVEWRIVFERLFPAAAPRLPPLTEKDLGRYDFVKDFIATIHDRDADRASYLVRCLRGAGRPVSSVRTPELAHLGLSDYELATMDRDRLNRLIAGLPPSAWLRPSELARVMGDESIARMLEAAEAED